MTTTKARVGHPAGAHHPSARWFAAFLATAWALAPGAPSSAQLIPIKTVPVASGDQFLFFPSDNLAMGGVGLALPDTLGDPFGNPATGSRISESVFFGSPTFYGISDRNGSGRTLPLGAFFSGRGLVRRWSPFPPGVERGGPEPGWARVSGRGSLVELGLALARVRPRISPKPRPETSMPSGSWVSAFRNGAFRSESADPTPTSAPWTAWSSSTPRPRRSSSPAICPTCGSGS